MSYIETSDGVELYVKEWGNGRPVVMMHGWPLSSDTWDDLALAVANAGMRAIAYDRRGFGRSEQPWEGYDYDTLADDLASVLEEMSAQDAVLIGFSMGGGEVARYLSRYSDNRIRKAVLLGSVVPYMLKTDDNPKGVPADVFAGMKQNITADRAKFWKGFFPDFYGVGTFSHSVSDEVVEWSRSVAMQASLKGTLDCVDAFGTTDFRPDLAAFRIPTLIIHGTADKIVPIDVSSREAAAGIRGAVLREYEGGPHGLLASHKTQLENDILDFLRA